MLAPVGTNPHAYGVSGRHARLFFDKDATITLAAVSRNYSIVLGHKEFTGGQRTITNRTSLITLGTLRYSLEYLQIQSPEYHNLFNVFLEEQLSRSPPPIDFSATPSIQDHVIGGNWNIRGTVGRGSFGLLNAAKNVITAESCAAKTIVGTRAGDYERIQREIETLKMLPKSVRLAPILICFANHVLVRTASMAGNLLRKG